MCLFGILVGSTDLGPDSLTYYLTQYIFILTFLFYLTLMIFFKNHASTFVALFGNIIFTVFQKRHEVQHYFESIKCYLNSFALFFGLDKLGGKIS